MEERPAYCRRSRFFTENAAASTGKRKKRPMQLFEMKLEPPLKQQKRSSGKTDSRPWTEKYAPKTTADIVGNKALVSRFSGWLRSWNAPGKPQRGGVLISGPPGIGKTAAATIVSKELGFQPILFCGSSLKGKPDRGKLSNVIAELSSRQLGMKGQLFKHAKSVLVLDELDGIDEAGCKACIEFLKRDSLPIICICNDRYCNSLRSMRGLCLDLSFQKPRADEVMKVLSMVAEKERLPIEKAQLAMVVNSAQRDIRQALNQMQYIFAGVQQGCGRLCFAPKDAFFSPFSAVESLCAEPGVTPVPLEDGAKMVSQDQDLVFLLIQENYVDYTPYNLRGTSLMATLTRAAECLCVADMLTHDMHHYQQWDLSPLLCAILALTCSSIVQGSRRCLTTGDRPRLRFPQWLVKNSASTKGPRDLRPPFQKVGITKPAVVEDRGPSAEMFAILKATKKAEVRALPVL